MAEDPRKPDPVEPNESPPDTPLLRPAMFLVTGPLDQLRLRLASGFYDRPKVQRAVAKRILEGLRKTDPETGEE